MNEQISFIVDVQNIDLELSKLDDILSKASLEITELEQLLASKEAELERLNGELTDINKKIGTSELDVKSYEEKIIKMKDTQKLLQTNKENNAIQKSAKDSEALKKKSEDELMSYMESKDSVNGEIAAVRKDAGDIAAALADKNAGHKKNKTEFDGARKDFISKREDAASRIKKDYLDIYEAVKRNKGFPAISPVMKSGACTGCYRMLPPQQFNELISGNVFMQCPVCSRILYIDVDAAAAEKQGPPNRKKNKAEA